MFSLLSYNILFGSKLEAIVNWINEKKNAFDFICFQEFPETDIHRINKLLPNVNYSHIYSPGVHVRGNTYGELTLFNTTHIKLDNFNIVDMGHGRWEKRILRVQGSRTTLIGRFNLGGKHIIIANAHLTMLSNNGKRLEQIDDVLEVMKKVKEPSIILGDFNYSSLFGRKKLFSIMHENGYTNAVKEQKTHKLFLIKHQLDYVFYKKLRVKSVSVNHSINLSDHYPITIEFKISS